ncbi:MAG: hypothetical protein ABIH37_00710 [archaeon]
MKQPTTQKQANIRIRSLKKQISNIEKVKKKLKVKKPVKKKKKAAKRKKRK